MTKLFTFAIVTFCLAVTSANAQISTNFFNNSAPGIFTGNSNFSLTDANGFSALFGAPGEIVFFQNGSLYNASNRAFGVDGGQTSVINFNQAADLTLSGLDTNGQTTGGAGAVTLPNATLGLAVGTIEGFDAAGSSLGSFSITEGGFTNFSFNNVSSLQLSNTGPTGSFSLIGDISATPSSVPEPTSGILMAGLLGLVSLRRRR